MANELFLGEFTITGKTYEVIEEDYLELSADIPADMLIQAAKRMAMIRMTKATYEPKNQATSTPLHEDMDVMGDDPIERFTHTAIIFDGNNLAHRVRHSYNLTHKGQDVSILYGFLNVMKSIIRRYADVAVIAVCWDWGLPEYRRETIPDYKANRSHDDDDYEDFIRQVQILDNILPAFGVLSLRFYHCEADDLMACFANLTHGDCLNVLVSDDKDLLQCVDYHTVVHSTSFKHDVTLENFEELVGIAKADYMTYRAIVGDSSDGLKGIFGLGDANAKKLIAEYSSPSNMVNVANGKNPEAKSMTPKLAEKLRTFGLKGFGDMFTVMRLDYDKTGARSFILDEFDYWYEYDKLHVVAFLKKWMFVSLMEPQFYNLFKNLQPPENVLMQDLGYRVRIPRPNVKKQPITLNN